VAYRVGLMLLVGLLACPPRAEVAAAQDVALAKPRFIATWVAPGEPADATNAAVLQRRVSLELSEVPLGVALRSIASQARLDLSYDKSVLPAGRRVSLHAREITVVGALTEVLLNSGLDVAVGRTGQLGWVPRPPQVAVDSGAIVGRVTDARTGDGLNAVDLVIEGAAFQASTGEDGRYRIANVPAGSYTLLARRIGYARQSQPIRVEGDTETTADFALQPAVTKLNELVVTATGEQPRAQIGNVIGRIQADSLVPSGPINNMMDLLTARVSGLEVRQANGLTGQSTQLRIRGVNNLIGTNEPIVVIDGVRVDNAPGDIALNTTGSSVQGFASAWFLFGQLSGSLTNLNPNEIESIEVVKGPSAATLYGTDAANGVIVVTTKRGQVGRPRLTMYTEQGLVEPTGGIPDNYYAWGHSLADGSPTQCLLTSRAAGFCAIDSVTHYNPLNDPGITPLGNGYRQLYGGQVSGGSAALRYFGSAEYENERGYLEMPATDQARIQQLRGGEAIPDYEVHPNRLRKVSLRGNLDAALGRKADLAVSIGLLDNLVRIPPDGVPFAGAEYGPGYRDVNNGYAAFYGGQPGELFGQRGDQHAKRLTLSSTTTWHPLSWLTSRATAGIDYTNTFLDGLQLPNQGPSYFPAGERWNSRGSTILYSADAALTGGWQLSRSLRWTSTVGGQYNRKTFGQTTATGRNLAPGAEVGSGAGSQVVGEVNQDNVIAGAFVEQGIGFKERLFLSGAVRMDGSSAFGEDFRTAFYPKASVSWVVSNQPATSWLSQLRLRAAYGSSGVQPDPSAKLTLLSLQNGLVDGTTQPGVFVSQLGNPNLKPERETEFESGLDAELWGGRIQLEGTFYTRRGTDVLVTVPVAQSLGVATQQQNIGTVRNRGIELSARTQILNGRMLGLDAGAQLSVNHNTALSLAPTAQGINSTAYSFVQHRVGYPLFGAYERPLLAYNDANGDGIIAPNEITLGDTAVFVGPTIPTTQLTLSGGITLFGGRMRLSSLFDYRGGFRFLDLTDGGFRCGFIGNCREKNDPSTPLADQARAVAIDQGGSFAPFMVDGTYWRWREASVRLTLPPKWAAGLRSHELALTLSARNLALWTKTPDINPEQGELDGAFADIRFAVPTAPQARYWLLRVDWGF
jgi:TonB-linked SusC/RagA family outer membrane protein